MKLRYLGTAAAEGWPAMFCDCDSCKRAVAAGGKNLRSRSQAIIDERLLIDFPADTYMHVLYQGLNLKKITSCIITHNHSDHLYPADLEMRKKDFAYLPYENLLTIYGTQSTIKMANELIHLYGITTEGRVVCKDITAFVPFTADGYTITPLKADHDPLYDCVIYIISDGEKTILYGHDTGYFPDETWSYFEKSHPHFDFVSLDCTFGVIELNKYHMGISADADVRKRLMDIGCSDTNTVFCANHFSHNGKATYDEMVPIAGKNDFIVSYDGMAVEI